MHKIKFIAPKYLIAPLALLGIKTYPADSAVEAKNALAQATQKKDPSLIFITEQLTVDLQESIAKLNKNPNINIVLIPDNKGSIGLATEQIERLVKNSIGAPARPAGGEVKINNE